MRAILFLLTISILAACASRSITPNVKEVKVSREQPAKNCKEIGSLTGTTATVKGTQDQAVEDLKKEAANKGANYVVVKQFSSYGTTVTGIGYECP